MGRMEHKIIQFMKKICFLLFILTVYNGKAERGEIVSYQLVREWNSRQVVTESFDMVDNYIHGLATDSSTQAILTRVFKAYIARNIQARSLSFYKIEYKTIDIDDNEAVASGLVIIPKRPNGVCSYGVGVYNHGTIFAKDEVPSLYFENYKYREGELFFSVIMAAMEHIMAVPDYYGMGTGTGIHHHNMDKTNSNSVIDIIRATRRLATTLGIIVNPNVSLTGYSEGGTVTMNTAKRIFEENLQHEFPNVLICPASGAYDLSTETYNFIFSNPYYPTRSYILYIAASCQDMYHNLYNPDDPNGIKDYLTAPYDQLYTENLPTQTGNVGWVPLPWTQMFYDSTLESVYNNPQHPFRTCLEQNDCYNWHNPYETHIYYCNTDEQVPPSGAVKTYNTQQAYIPPENFWDRYKLQIQEVSFDGYFNAHELCAIPSMFLTIENMRARRNIKCVHSDRLNTKDTSDISIDKTQNYQISIASQDKVIEVKDIRNNSFYINKSEVGDFNIYSLKEGIYFFKPKDNNEIYEWDYFIKTPLNYVNTTDYNPIQIDVQGKYFVDISRLHEQVARIDILDENGEKMTSITAENNKDKIYLNQMLANANYTVMVITMQQNTYPLLWEKRILLLYNHNLDIRLLYKKITF